MEYLATINKSRLYDSSRTNDKLPAGIQNTNKRTKLSFPCWRNKSFLSHRPNEVSCAKQLLLCSYFVHLFSAHSKMKHSICGCIVCANKTSIVCTMNTLKTNNIYKLNKHHVILIIDYICQILASFTHASTTNKNNFHNPYTQFRKIALPNLHLLKTQKKWKQKFHRFLDVKTACNNYLTRQQQQQHSI